jgi:dTDP-4-amino-4,6-dideoxygalactose transaminase
METLCGRTALEHIVEILVKQGKKTAYLPSYCCHTMIEPFLTHGMEVKFYDIEITPYGISRKNVDDDYEAILLMDYFGHTDAETIEIARRENSKGKITIYDATHSMNSPVDTTPYDFVYGSYRKWVDINCGFLAWKEELSHGEITQNDNYQVYSSVREMLFDLKADFINGGKTSKDDFLPLIEKAETILEEQYHHKMPDKRSIEVLKRTDASYVKIRRMENARVLTEAINDMNDERVRCITPVLNTADVPLFIPVIVAPTCRNSLRRYLIENQIYCPVHWPVSELHSIMPGSKQLFESELSLICDQRYDSSDMNRIAETIYNYLKS